MKKLLVVSCAALGAAEARRAGLERNLGPVLEVEPVFPALTVPAQAALLTGSPPAETGAVGNGFFHRELRRVFFWEQSAELVAGERPWERLERESGCAASSALLFFQNSLGANADVVVTPAPIHAPDGRTIPACYTQPGALGQMLEGALGPFPLQHYWGPMAGLGASQWIAAAAAMVLGTSVPDFSQPADDSAAARPFADLPVGISGIQKICRGGSPDLTYVYLPHLDYDFQRFGPDSPQAAKALQELAAMLCRLAEVAESAGCVLVIAGDYAIERAGQVVLPNRALRAAGLLAVRRVGAFELLDLGASRAFAVVDHQIAHVYCQNGAAPEDAAEALAGLAGIGRMLDRASQAELGLDHPRSGDLVLEAVPGCWCAYDWWLDESAAPPYARTVDIHNKPGYDPLELFFAPDRKGTARDGNLVKGTHGRSGGAPAALVLPEGAEAPAGRLKATEVAGLLSRLAAD